MQRKQRISIIGTVGLPARYGGFETLAHHLVKHLGQAYDLTVYCSSKAYKPEERKSSFNGAKLAYLPLKANGIQSILYDALSILRAVFHSDVLLVLGVSGAWILPLIRLFTGIKIITSIDGLEWKREKWGLLARLYLRWAEKIAVYYSHIDISDNDSIQNYTALRYGTLSKVIEYGGDHVRHEVPTQEDVEAYPFLQKEYNFSVCRIEPENNVQMILEAFKNQRDRTMVMLGNWDNSVFGREMKETYKNHENIILLDAIYDQRILDVLRSNASLYVHGHSAGGTNPSLVEAMSLGLPILAFNVSYNVTTTERKAKYFKSAEELQSIVRSITMDKRTMLGRTMKQIAERRYTWKVIVNQYQYLFELEKETSKKGIRPTIVTASYEHLASNKALHLRHSNLLYEEL